MSKQTDKIDLPKYIVDDLFTFISRNKDYNKTTIPINLIDTSLTLQELLCLYRFLTFKLNHTLELELNEADIESLNKGKEAMEDSLKSDTFLETFEDSRKTIKNLYEKILKYSNKVLLALLMESLSEYQENTISTLRYVEDKEKELNAQASTNINLIGIKERKPLFSNLKKQNNDLSKELLKAYMSSYSIKIYLYALVIKNKIDKYNEKTQNLIPKLFKLIDEEIFYTFALLNCQKLLLQYYKNLYPFLISPNSEELTTSMKEIEYSSTIKIYYITQVYEEVFPKFKSTMSLISKKINEIIDENE